MTCISIEGISKRFGSTTAVDGVDLQIESGDLFFLLGPSGCGKTTLLRMLAGFIEPSGGRIRFNEKDVTTLPPNRRNTGMVFQSYALWPHMTVAENVAYGLRVRKVDGPTRKSRVASALDAVQMGPYAQRRPNQLSGGQQQRVALARALVIEPEVLLLDEPLSNLDAKLRLEMRQEIRRLCKSSGITTVYVTHDQEEALSMADRMAVLKDGSLQQLGPPQSLYRQPRTRFVAEFLGETNLLPATVGGRDGSQVRLETVVGEVLATVPSDEFPAGGNITCSIRPESFRWTSSDASLPLKGRVQDVVFLGDVTQAVVGFDGGHSIRTIALNQGKRPEPGEEASLFVDPQDVVILSD
ncbi:MAG: ABC transporter ATP-binding protein [Planctomycetota bacterium]|nr:ABC transporter ATP-binding protein [Planctomycetota bacterium]